MPFFMVPDSIKPLPNFVASSLLGGLNASSFLKNVISDRWSQVRSLLLFLGIDGLRGKFSGLLRQQRVCQALLNRQWLAM